MSASGSDGSRCQQGLLAATVDTSPPLREPAGSPSIRAIQVETGPTIDGQLDESVWLQAPAGPLWQYDPATSEAMSEKTFVFFTTRITHIGVWCYDSDQGPSMHGSCSATTDPSTATTISTWPWIPSTTSAMDIFLSSTRTVHVTTVCAITFS